MPPKKRGGRRGKASKAETDAPTPEQHLAPPIKKEEAPPVQQPQEVPKNLPQTGPTLQGAHALPKEEPSTSEEDLVPFEPGKKGRKITIETNHVKLDLGTIEKVFRYDVSIEPEKKPRRMYRAAWNLFQKAHFPNHHPSYDGQKLLFSAKHLPLKDDSLSGKVNLTTEDGKTMEFTVTVKLTGMLSLSPLRNLLQKKNGRLEEALQCVEIVFRQAYTSSFLNVGRRFYTRTQEFPLGASAEMYLGGFQAVVKGTVPLFNVDVAHKAFTKAVRLTDVVMEMFSTRHQPIDLQRFELKAWQAGPMEAYLKGFKVTYELRGLKKQYKINGLAKDAKNEKFQEDDGRTSTVYDFYKVKRQVQLKYPNLPTLWVGNSQKRICVPMEFCVLKEGQPVEGPKMLSSQTATMIKYAATSTDERKRKIQNVMMQAGHNQHPCIQEFGFKLGTNFEKLGARVLDVPSLAYLNDAVTPNNGSWMSRRFMQGAQISKWTIVGYGVYQNNVNDNVHQLASMIQQFGVKNGMSLPEASKPFDYVKRGVRDLTACLQRKKDFDLIVVIIGNKDDYYQVKQVAELDLGCLTQCFKAETLKRLSPSTVSNLLLKINAKLNGTNHALSQMGLLTDEPCMVMGADVTHPGPQARHIPSVVAITASFNHTATHYSCSAYLQNPRTEIIQDLESITLKKLQVFKHNNKNPPSRIYFLRDGVSEGEFDKVRKVEIDAIRRGCQRFRPEYNPKLTFIVVQKRHHARFFPTDQDSVAQRDKHRNVPVGTCVDTVIVDRTFTNFYLLSHQSIQGVGRPTKYSVLLDENQLTSDDFQQLVYYLCHLYVRCNRSVSYPAPTYYAHLMATRAKGYLFGKNCDVQNLDQRLVQIKQELQEKFPMMFC